MNDHVQSEYPKLFALTIGINQYSNPCYRHLQGCVADTDAVDAFLLEELGVPEAQITSLRDSQATRHPIIKAIESFIVDHRIEENNPILIYFAGHGSEAKSPAGWFSEDSKSQLLIPYDCGEIVEGQTIHGIPDRTFGWLLKQIADSKGHNISVVLDSCCSGSGTRAIPELLVARKVNYNLELPYNLDDRLHPKHSGETGSKEIHIAPGFDNGGLKSHVLLAACGSGELARETHGRGAFTQALLDTLHGRNIQKITYSNLLHLMPALSMQNPQCEGAYKNRIIFDGKVPLHHRIIYKTSLDSRTLKICAGAAHGITAGSKFSIWRNDGSYLGNGRPLTTVVVGIINPLSSVVTSDFDETFISVNGTCFVAELIEPGKAPDLRVYIPPDPQMNVVFNSLFGMQRGPDKAIMNFILSTIENAHFSIVWENGFCIDIHDLEVNQHGLKRLPHVIPLGTDAFMMRKIFHGLAHYEYHLRRSNTMQSRRSPLRKNVSLEIYRTPPYSRTDVSISPQGTNLNDPEKGIELIQDDSWYVFKLNNQTTVDLYPALFYFDNCDLSIHSLYEPPSGQNKVDPPLKAGQSLTIGYGGGGGVPYVFNVRQSQAFEIGFLKLFLATEYLDFSNIGQDSPLEINSRSMEQFLSKRTSGQWDTILVPFVVRKRSFSSGTATDSP
ncbi:caspase domain-containing protein [Gymnopilus junonius]|uniref:Caspase domain-containing protein n=1 Tax=Gymnopilus junonius TaxID=109634 RepID=A0A9P5N921_GYMJU|nr:caspase domain-containing protein [Gymnopilus junonius]